MDFTIITPNRNYGRFLEDCLSSVESQPGVQVEHLLLDAGSTDESREVAARFPHVTWIDSDDNGMSQAINRGFDRAQGRWVMWLNADDRFKPEVLRPLLEKLERSTADVVYGDFDFIAEEGRWIRSVRLPRWSPFIHIHHHCYIGSTAAFYRKASVIDAGFRLREDFRYVMDGEYYIRLHAAGKGFEHVSMNLADFRLHGGNASMKHLSKDADFDTYVAAERQHVESRAIRRYYGFTPFRDPYLNGISDAFLWVVARAWKAILKKAECGGS
jgi:glycosyltransferase involved in cell wall biosynthesis